LLTDWIAHTPPEVLAKNFGVPVEAFKNIPVHNNWIYHTATPPPPPPPPARWTVRRAPRVAAASWRPGSG
jgi:hypothetical protein